MCWPGRRRAQAGCFLKLSSRFLARARAGLARANAAICAAGTCARGAARGDAHSRARSPAAGRVNPACFPSVVAAARRDALSRHLRCFRGRGVPAAARVAAGGVFAALQRGVRSFSPFGWLARRLGQLGRGAGAAADLERGRHLELHRGAAGALRGSLQGACCCVAQTQGSCALRLRAPHTGQLTAAPPAVHRHPRRRHPAVAAGRGQHHHCQPSSSAAGRRCRRPARRLPLERKGAPSHPRAPLRMRHGASRAPRQRCASALRRTRAVARRTCVAPPGRAASDACRGRRCVPRSCLTARSFCWWATTRR